MDEVRRLREENEAALDLAMRYGQTDGDYHKAWVIDQMVRILTGCPEETVEATDVRGERYTPTPGSARRPNTSGSWRMPPRAASTNGTKG